jgi:hypothetical protein
MNAIELADALEIAKNKLIGKEYELGGKAIIIYTEAATMLRQFGLAESIIKQQQLEIEALKETVDKLLNHCDDPECWECGKIICPYGGEMHFHHDGCPTCAQMEAQEK